MSQLIDFSSFVVVMSLLGAVLFWSQNSVSWVRVARVHNFLFHFNWQEVSRKGHKKMKTGTVGLFSQKICLIAHACTHTHTNTYTFNWSAENHRGKLDQAIKYLLIQYHPTYLIIHSVIEWPLLWRWHSVMMICSFSFQSQSNPLHSPFAPHWTFLWLIMIFKIDGWVNLESTNKPAW